MSIDMCATCKNCESCTFPRHRPVANCDEFADRDSHPTFKVIRGDAKFIVADRNRTRETRHAVAG